MLSIIRNLFQRRREGSGFVFSRPLVSLQSDDWGRVGVRDREGYEWLRTRGLRLGERPYDFYTLETANDVEAVAALLASHRDSTGRSACMTLNVCTANLDFDRMREEGYTRIAVIPLGKGLPGKWSRPGLFDSYRKGVDDGVFFPSPHGTIHCSLLALQQALDQGGNRAALLKLLWEAETPYIYWRMPWAGFEYLNGTGKRASFISLGEQRSLIEQSFQNFSELFGTKPISACAPGCRANTDTHRIWAENGVRVAENGTSNGLRPPHMDDFGILHLYRSIDFEPSHRQLEVEKYMEIAAAYFSRGLPLIISVHAINFHSTLKDFRSESIASLDRLLTALEVKYPELLYVNDADLHAIVTEGAFQSHAAKINVDVSRCDWNLRLVQQEAS